MYAIKRKGMRQEITKYPLLNQDVNKIISIQCFLRRKDAKDYLIVNGLDGLRGWKIVKLKEVK